MNSPFGQYCPVCKYKNDSETTICINCQTPLVQVQHAQITTRRLTENGAVLSADEVENRLKLFTPTEGLTFYIINTGELIVVEDKHSLLILGRRVENIIDNPSEDETLINIGASDMFVSRRHAKVAQNATGYEITDLNSSNGTWIGDQRLIPNRSYVMKSGMRIRLGHVQTVVHFAEPPSK
jgi:hypothetical protein